MNTSELVHSAVSIAEVLKRFGSNTLLLNEAGWVLRYADEAAYAQRAQFKATKRTLVL